MSNGDRTVKQMNDAEIAEQLRLRASRKCVDADLDRCAADQIEYLRRLADAAIRTRDEALADVAKVQANIDAVNRAMINAAKDTTDER